MAEKYDDIILVKLISKKMECIKRDNYVGYCHYTPHRGVLTKTLLKNHECLEKGCFYFEKNKDNPYVDNVKQSEKAQKQEKKTAKKLNKQKKRKAELLKENIQEIADISRLDIRIISVREITERKHIIYYISREARDDRREYVNLLIALRCVSKGHYEMRHIKDINGNYVVY